ncbi:YjzD family protein [Listeria costaricensis]|uniref:YjzD family protein n=1 Tax=Listeria costaricensis TaxID=2026604 RepID=UPI000C077A14|nr:YjzD family protein [Listeria costaricensis]
MRYIVTVIWVFFLSMMAEFVLSSMLYVPFDFTRGIILTVGISIFMIIIPLLMPKDSEIYDIK